MQAEDLEEANLLITSLISQRENMTNFYLKELVKNQRAQQTIQNLTLKIIELQDDVEKTSKKKPSS